MQIKTTIKCHYTPIRVAQIKNHGSSKQCILSRIAGGAKKNGTANLDNSLAVHFTVKHTITTTPLCGIYLRLIKTDIHTNIIFYYIEYIIFY